MPVPRAALPLALAAALACVGAHATPARAARAAAAPLPQGAASEPLLPYTVTPHDTLIGLNRTLFAEPHAWPEVARINRLPDSNRIRPGQVLLVPEHLLHSRTVPAKLVSAFGDVRVAGRPAAAGTDVDVGAAILTGEAGTAVVELADGSRIKLAPNSEGRLDEHRRFQVRATAAAIDDGLVAATLRLISGSLEVVATKVLRARPLEVSTPTAVIGVRGTRYRVRNDHAGGDLSATEVLEGKVHAQVGGDAARSVDVPATFGAPLEAGKAPQVLPLPPAPDLSALPASFDQLPLRYHVPGDPALRVQVADDAAFEHIALDLRVIEGDELRIPQLPDGTWHLRARRIGAEGLEGLDAERTIVMRARPESPFGVEPANGAKLPVGDVTLRWTGQPEAARFDIEVARDAGFSQLAQRVAGVAGREVVFHPTGSDFGAPDGTYFWRIVSIDASGRRGAWSEVQAFTLRPVPRAALAQVSPDGSAVELRWAGKAGDVAQAELARDPAFREVVAHADFPAAGSGRFSRPDAGAYWARYRFVEPDGFRGAWSDPVRLDVTADWTKGWRAVLPGLASAPR
ncbi:MAG: FecR domain-containing protein [Burkholderiaceae bacterium]